MGIYLTDFIALSRKTYFKIIPVLLGFALLTSALPACTSSPAPDNGFSAADIEAIRAYADPETETTLTGLSADNYEEYTKYFNAATKAAATKEVVDRAAAQINAKLGPYKSKEFLRVEKADNYIVVHYRASYMKGEIGVRMVFDNDHLIAGQWFE